LPARTLFDLIDRKVEGYAEQIRSRVFSAYRNIHWTPEQRKLLQPLVREQLDWLVYSIFEVMDNKGDGLPDMPDGTVGYNIHNVVWDARSDSVSEGDDISTDEMAYSDMWLDYKYDKEANK